MRLDATTTHNAERASFAGAPVPVSDDDADRELDRGPGGLWQRRLPGAGFVRLAEWRIPPIDTPARPTA